MHTDSIPTALITVMEARNTRDLIESWLCELECSGRLDSQKGYEFYELFDRLQTSIELDNLDCFGRLAVRELRPNAMAIFETIIFWVNETCPEHSKKFRQSLH